MKKTLINYISNLAIEGNYGRLESLLNFLIADCETMDSLVIDKNKIRVLDNENYNKPETVSDDFFLTTIHNGILKIASLNHKDIIKVICTIKIVANSRANVHKDKLSEIKVSDLVLAASLEKTPAERKLMGEIADACKKIAVPLRDATVGLDFKVAMILFGIFFLDRMFLTVFEGLKTKASRVSMLSKVFYPPTVKNDSAIHNYCLKCMNPSGWEQPLLELITAKNSIRFMAVMFYCVGERQDASWLLDEGYCPDEYAQL